MKYITESDIDYYDAVLMPERFIIINMWNQGIWLVDMEYSKWEKIKETALAIARTFGDPKSIEQLEAL